MKFADEIPKEYLSQRVPVVAHSIVLKLYEVVRCFFIVYNFFRPIYKMLHTFLRM